MIITQTPLRVSFLGGGTDFPGFFGKYGGGVVSSAIDKNIYTIVKERFDDKIYVNYSEKEIVETPDELQHELVREALKKVGIHKGIEISFLADIPSEGSGLGSSSSVTVGVLNALYHMVGHIPSAEQLAKEACQIEIDVLGKPIGVQDQYIAAFGGLRFLEFKKNGKVVAHPIRTQNHLIEDLDNYLMLFFTGKTRKSATILAEQKQNIAHKEKVLREMTAQARAARKYLEKGEILKLGELLHQGWLLKRKLATKISNPEFDQLYDEAIEAGAIGGKIAGAGGGGFFLLFVPSDKRGGVRKALTGLREMPFHLERDGSKVIFNVRRY